MENQENEVIENETMEMDLDEDQEVEENDDTSSVSDQDNDHDENEEHSENSDETEVKASKENGVKKRIGKLAKQRDEAKREAEYYRKLLMDKESKVESKESTQNRPKSSDAPNEDDYESFEEYISATIQYGIDQGLKARDERTQNELASQKEVKRAEVWQKNQTAFMDETPDYEDVLDNVEHINISSAIREAIIESDLGPQVLYEIAKNPDEAERIASLSDYAAIREIGKIEYMLQLKKQEKKTVTTSKAPRPINSVKGSAKVSKDPNMMSFAEYQAWREKTA